MKKLTIIDGSGFLFRAWYGYPEMRNAQGENQNVVYGFIRMIIKLLEEPRDYFSIARDAPAKTKRHERYQDYKANRKKIEDDFKRQIPLVQELVHSLGIPTAIAPGYEADDIIATLVNNHQHNPDLCIQVFSSDKDLKQFLSESTVITDPVKNITTQVKDFELEYGFAPTAILDYLALIGDSADNIKWVAGIGPKKASDLIQKYQSIEHIYQQCERADSPIAKELREKLLLGKEDAFFSKKLIELLEVPELSQSPLDQWKLRIDIPAWEEILLKKRGFTNLSKQLAILKKQQAQPQQLGLF